MNFALLLTRLTKFSQVLCSTRFLRALLCYRVLAGAEHRNILTRDLATVVDIGANRGQFTPAVRKWIPNARVIAFEPLTEAGITFRAVFQGDSGVTLHQTAIGPQAGETTIHVATADDSSSLLPISPLQVRLFPGTGEIRTEKIKVARLSDYVLPEEIDPPALLKLDVQGYELEALRGCEELLTRFSYIYAECSFVELYTGQALVDEIIAWLRERGWCLDGIFNMTYDRDGKSVQADFIFKKSVLRCCVRNKNKHL